MKQTHRIAMAFATLVASVLFTSAATATPFAQTNLVSNVTGLAQITDPNLRNPWGMSFAPAGPFWISDQGTNLSTLYRAVNGVATVVPLVVSIPTTTAGPQGPTGQVFNNAGANTFLLANNAPATFIFANLNGTISAWNGAAGTVAQVRATTPGRVYTGLAIAGSGANARLFAASSAGIDVFDSTFALVSSNSFVNNDPRIAGLVPFNVQTIGSNVYVTYALPGRNAQIAAAEGSGAVAIFNTAGVLQETLVAGSRLASPWGVAIAPSTFGGFGGALLVGNFSFVVAEINAFDPLTGAYLGTIADQLGNPLINSGLWGIAFGNGASGSANTLYFNAGINGERDGLFGSIAAIPEPEMAWLLVAGLGALLLGKRRGRAD